MHTPKAKPPGRRRHPPPPGRHGREDDANAFLPDPSDGGPMRASDSLAEELGEDFVASITSGDHAAEETRSADYAEEFGGPFIASRAEDEFADDIDESNPIDAEPESLPAPMRGMRSPKEE